MNTRYEVRYRRKAIIGLVGFPAVIALFLLWALPVNRSMFPVFAGFSVFICVCALHFSWFTLFLLTEYRPTEDGIMQTGSVLGRPKHLRYCDIRSYREFTYEPRAERAKGYILVGRDGTQIKLIDALPIWNDVVQRLQGVPKEPHSYAVGVLLRVFGAT